MVSLAIRVAYAECRFKEPISDNTVTYRFSSDETTSGRLFLISDAFWMYVSRKDNINGLLSQLPDGSFHAWDPLKMGYLSTTEYEKTKWFKEGFTEYYAQRITLAGGERSAEQVVASTNKDLLAFPSSTDEYVRGRIIALWLDAAIREQAKGKHSLDDVMFRLVRDYKEPLTEDRIYATIQPYLSADQLSLLKAAADHGGDLPAQTPPRDTGALRSSFPEASGRPSM